VSKGRRPRGKAGKPRYEVDRIVVLRLGIAVIAIVFLYLILKMSMIAFGGSNARNAKRIERAVDPATATRSSNVAAPAQSGAAPGH